MILHWFRRDLRLTDNTALNAAHRASGGAVLPVYIQSEWSRPHRWAGAPRQAFLCGSLQELSAGLTALGGNLIVRRGCADTELERLVRESGATAITFNRDPDPFGRAMEAKVEAMAARLGIQALGYDDVTALTPGSVRTGTGGPFRVFTPFSKAWLQQAIPAPGPDLATLGRLQPMAPLDSLPLPTLADWGLTATAAIPAPGEAAARKRMETFFNSIIGRYGAERDIPAVVATSQLSADLRWGTLSIRELIARSQHAIRHGESEPARKSASKYLSELIWREFYMAILHEWPGVLDHEFQPQFIGLPWLAEGQPVRGALLGSGVEPGEAWERWCHGTTGFPIVDAGMRQLAATGWMHNRVRMIVAMFLTKDLHLDWRRGEQFFMQQLVDGEIASNNGGWQWSAGTGADAAPYFRIQNPWTQTSRYDPEGAYIKQWVPELRDCQPAQLMNPPAPGLRLAKGYPLPIVDHSRERDVTLAVFAEHKATL
jgi:deoxyribodipyrimidine photo-lyase